MEISLEFNPDPADSEALSQKLFRNNALAIQDYAYQDFMLRSTDASGACLAGLHGEIGGGWLYIASLWVDEAVRGLGLGKALLARAEEIALENECVGLYLYTYSFQAPEFYERLGYRVFGALEQYCTDHSKLFMKKVLASTNGSMTPAE